MIDRIEGPRQIRRMNRLGWLLALTVLTGPLAAQREVSLSIGATRSSRLVADPVIREDVTTLRPAIAPTVALAASFFTASPYHLTLEARYATSKLDVSEGDTRDQLSRVATIGIVAMVDAAIHGDFRAEVGGGSIWYRPSERTGVFQQGGTRHWMLAAGVSWRRVLTPRITLLVTAHYDFHDFTTAQLQSRDVQGSQAVHRIGLTAGLSRRF